MSEEQIIERKVKYFNKWLIEGTKDYELYMNGDF